MWLLHIAWLISLALTSSCNKIYRELLLSLRTVMTTKTWHLTAVIGNCLRPMAPDTPCTAAWSAAGIWPSCTIKEECEIWNTAPHRDASLTCCIRPCPITVGGVATVATPRGVTVTVSGSPRVATGTGPTACPLASRSLALYVALWLEMTPSLDFGSKPAQVK